jgi:HPt (histidine-containing phosphotransfer) domain-containing protein
MERELLRQIWPIFSAEAREHLQTIGAAVLELEREPGQAGVLDGLRRTAHSLKGSAGSLGLADVETLAHAIEGSLAGFDPAEGLARAAVQAGSARPPVRRRRAGSVGPARPRRQGARRRGGARAGVSPAGRTRPGPRRPEASASCRWAAPST